MIGQNTNHHPVRPLPADDIEHVLAHTRPLWDALHGQRLFITGGTGFVGHWLLETFIAANTRFALGATATILSRNPEAFRLKAPHLVACPDLNLVQGDVASFPFPPGKFDSLIHAATEVADRNCPDAAARQMIDILDGTRRVSAFAKQADVKNLLFVSSGAVYGTQPPDLHRVPETWQGSPETTSPASGYGIGKQASEHLLAVNAGGHGYQLKIARCFAFLGPHLDPERFAIGNFIRDALAGQPVKVLGDGTPRRSYLYAADLAVWLWTIFFKGASGGIYNTGSPDSVSIAECAQTVAAVINPTLPVLIGTPSNPSGPASCYVPDTSRAMAELGLQPLVPLSEGIRRTAAWLTAPPFLST